LLRRLLNRVWTSDITYLRTGEGGRRPGCPGAGSRGRCRGRRSRPSRTHQPGAVPYWCTGVRRGWLRCCRRGGPDAPGAAARLADRRSRVLDRHHLRMQKCGVGVRCGAGASPGTACVSSSSTILAEGKREVAPGLLRGTGRQHRRSSKYPVAQQDRALPAAVEANLGTVERPHPGQTEDGHFAAAKTFPHSDVFSTADSGGRRGASRCCGTRWQAWHGMPSRSWRP
jgi:hypothetical protein